MKKDKIRILFVEDVENDMEIAIHELQKEWSDFTWRRVDDRENLIMQLGQFKPDVVISDYSMPNLNGLEALEVILSMAPGIPVIMFTGSVNEETAVACMKAGATDYVLKDKIKRLPYALREALSQKEINLAREQAEKALRENTERYSTFLNSTNDLVFLKDQEFRYLLTNKSYQQLLGKSDQEIIGHTDFEILGENEAANCRKSDEKVIEANSLYISKEYIGDEIYEARKFPVVLGDGMTGVGGFLKNITTQVKAESMLDLQDTILSTVANAVMITDIEGKVLSVNSAFTHMTGFTEEDIIGEKSGDHLVLGLHDEEFYNSMRDTILSGKVWHGELINRRKDGTFYNEENTITPYRDSQGNIIRFIAVKQDITERKVSELALEASERKYRQLVDNALIGIYTTTIEGKFIDANDPMCKMLDVESDTELKKISIQDLYKWPEQRKILVDKLLNEGKIKNFEVELSTIRGRERSVIVNAILEESHIIGMAMDMTERKKYEVELKKAKEKAEENDKIKTSFLANMSHEMRTPMNAILGYSELLSSPAYSESEKHDYVNIVSKSSKQLMRIMNDIVEVSKIASGQLTANPIPFDLNVLIRDICSQFSSVAENKKLVLSYKTGLPDLASRIKLDDMKLRHVLFNVIDNAIKFTEKGSVTVSYELKESILEFKVIDTGIGIQPEFKEAIFERFRQLDDSYTRKYGGSGLGLSIAKSYCEFLGGKIWVESVPGSGSTFFIHLPFIPVELPVKPPAETAVAPEDFSNYTILVAEDDDINFVYMERLLSKANSNIVRAANGQEAVDIINTGNPVDIILMDINMPFMNGLDATKIIKSVNPDLPIIAVTAYSLSGDRETCLSAGCDDYIPKPIRRDELFGKLNHYLV